MAVEKGRIPCAGHNCTTHAFRSGRGDPDALKKCFKLGYIPFDEDELAALKARWRERRHHVCPECGHPTDEMDHGEWEETNTWDGSTRTVEGLVCDCGWTGHENSAAFVKRES
jgi:hypothetical protein